MRHDRSPFFFTPSVYRFACFPPLCVKRKTKATLRWSDKRSLFPWHLLLVSWSCSGCWNRKQRTTFFFAYRPQERPNKVGDMTDEEMDMRRYQFLFLFRLFSLRGSRKPTTGDPAENSMACHAAELLATFSVGQPVIHPACLPSAANFVSQHHRTRKYVHKCTTSGTGWTADGPTGRLNLTFKSLSGAHDLCP